MSKGKEETPVEEKTRDEVKKYTKEAILLATKGVKHDALKFLLDDNKMYSLEEVEQIYRDFERGGNK